MPATVPLDRLPCNVVALIAESRSNLLPADIRIEGVSECLRVDVVELLHEENPYGASTWTGHGRVRGKRRGEGSHEGCSISSGTRKSPYASPGNTSRRVKLEASRRPTIRRHNSWHVCIPRMGAVWSDSPAG